jgi:hypothetical protein
MNNNNNSLCTKKQRKKEKSKERERERERERDDGNFPVHDKNCPFLLGPAFAGMASSVEIHYRIC